MSQYEINPRKKPEPYMTVSLYDQKPDMIALGFPKSNYKVLFDPRAGAELVMAINDLCRQSGHAYIRNLGEQDEMD